MEDASGGPLLSVAGKKRVLRYYEWVNGRPEIARQAPSRRRVSRKEEKVCRRTPRAQDPAPSGRSAQSAASERAVSGLRQPASAEGTERPLIQEALLWSFSKPNAAVCAEACYGRCEKTRASSTSDARAIAMSAQLKRRCERPFARSASSFALTDCGSADSAAMRSSPSISTGRFE